MRSLVLQHKKANLQRRDNQVFSDESEYLDEGYFAFED